MICNKIDRDCREIRCGSDIYGCIYCPSCLKSGNVKKAILEQCNERVPVIFLLHSKIPLQFFRKTQNKVVNAKIIGGFATLLIKENGVLFISLNFGDDFDVHRLVSLANIIKHSPGFYESLIHCENILQDIVLAPQIPEYPYNVVATNDIIISYDELPCNFKQLIELEYKKSQEIDSCQFLL